MNSTVIQDFKSRIFIITGAILLLFAVLITISNGLLLFVIYKDPLKTFRNATAVLVISLAVADFLTGCVTAVDVGISHILEGLDIQKVLLHAKIISQITVRGFDEDSMARKCLIAQHRYIRFYQMAHSPT